MVVINKNNTIRNDSDNNLTVGGYSFLSKEAAQAAKDELNAIKYVSSKTDSKDAKQVYMLYNTILLDWNILKNYKLFYIIAKKFQMIKSDLFQLILIHKVQ